VCPDDYFSEKMQKNSRFDYFYPLIIATHPCRNPKKSTGQQGRHYLEIEWHVCLTDKISNGARGTQ
jgi:hypothetical protein